MLKDAQGLEVRTNSVEAIAGINRYIDQSLSYGKEAGAILSAVAADPSCVLARVWAAAYYLSMESNETRKQARFHLEVAKHYATATEREQLYVGAVEAWEKGDTERAIAIHEIMALKYPRDLLSVQMGQYHYFYQGNKNGLLEIALQVLPESPENPYLLSMIAFGLEQCHRLEEAEAMGRKATELQQNNPWAHHAVAHVLETQKRVEEGIAWMESLAPTWEDCNTLLYTHNWWHLALYYLEKMDFPKILELYDRSIWGRAAKDSSKDQVGAISLLLRLELKGMDVGDRWLKIQPFLIPRLHEHSLAFHDLHYIYALAKGGQTQLVSEMLSSMETHANQVLPYLQPTWLEVALPAAKAMIAHATGDWVTVINELKPILSSLHAIGGSHAQRQLFEQVCLDAFLQATYGAKIPFWGDSVPSFIQQEVA